MKPAALAKNIDPHVIRYVLELPINRPDVFLRTTLERGEREADVGVDGSELWQEYRLWAARDPLSESAFLAALEKAGHRIIYDDDHVWFVDGWRYPGTTSSAPAKKSAHRPAKREYTFTTQTLNLEHLQRLAMITRDMNEVAEAIGWPPKKFAIYRNCFPVVTKVIEKVWRDNPDRFKPALPMDTDGLSHTEKAMRIASARRALCGAKARGNAGQIAACKERLKKLQGKD